MNYFNQSTDKNLINQKKSKLKMCFYFLFFILIFISLFAEFFINDKPILIKYNDQFYFPIVKTYSKLAFDIDDSEKIDYLNENIINLINKNGYAIWPLFKFTSNTKLSENISTKSSLNHWLGLTKSEFDSFANIIYGTRDLLITSIVFLVINSFVAIVIGIIESYFRGSFEFLIKIIINFFIIASILSMFLFTDKKIFWLMLLISLVYVQGMSQKIKLTFLNIFSHDYVKASKIFGVSKNKIIYKHIIPSIKAIIAINLPIKLCYLFIILIVLDYFKLGFTPSYPTIGQLLFQCINNQESYLLFLGIIFTLSVIFLGLISFNYSANKKYSKYIGVTL